MPPLIAFRGLNLKEPARDTVANNNTVENSPAYRRNQQEMWFYNSKMAILEYLESQNKHTIWTDDYCFTAYFDAIKPKTPYSGGFLAHQYVTRHTAEFPILIVTVCDLWESADNYNDPLSHQSHSLERDHDQVLIGIINRDKFSHLN